MGELGVVIHVVGVAVAASWAAYGLESVVTLHPVVRRAAQIALCAVAVGYAGRVMGVVG